MSKATKGIATFCLGYFLLCLDGHISISALVLEQLAKSLVEQSLKVKRSLSAFPDIPY